MWTVFARVAGLEMGVLAMVQAGLVPGPVSDQPEKFALTSDSFAVYDYKIMVYTVLRRIGWRLPADAYRLRKNYEKFFGGSTHGAKCKSAVARVVVCMRDCLGRLWQKGRE
jgi:hypothetical protein